MNMGLVQLSGSIHRICLMAALGLAAVLSIPDSLRAGSGKTSTDDRNFVFVEAFQGTSNVLGTVTKLDTMVGYRFTRHFEMDAGVPLYFVHASSSSTAAGFSSGNGIGDVYLDLKFSLSKSATSFVSSITGTAPTGDSTEGFSTGRVTVDWNNYLAFTSGRITPFANVGLANSISDTRFFTRPFTSLGMLAHFEGGADIRLWRPLSLGASAYAVTPFGEQKVYSKLIRHGQAVSSGGRGRGPKSGVFENQSETVGDASIVRDNGGSVWLDLSPGDAADFQVGFSRSTEYDLNSVFFSILLNIGRWVRSRP